MNARAMNLKPEPEPAETAAGEAPARPETGKVVRLPRPRRGLAPLAAAGKNIVASLAPPVLILFLLLVVWQMACSDPASLFPAPLTIWTESNELIVDPFFDRGGVDRGLFWHVSSSLSRVAIGFSMAAVVGVLVGAWVGTSQWAHRGFDPIFQVLRTVPPLAWLPISLAIFREAQPSAFFVIFITAIWPVILNTAVGIRNLPADYVNIGRVLRLTPPEMFVRIILPAATPHIFTGLRLGIGMSWLAIIASEMLLGGVGIGFFIWDQYNASRISDIVVALIWVGLVGFALDRFVALLGHLASRGSAKS
jgi:nitrate/nitrite transport system permease protein